MRKITYTMLEQHCIRILFSQCCPKTTLHKRCWLKVHIYTFAGKPAVSNMSGSLFLTEYYITEQSWVFLFNVGSGFYLRLSGQQLTWDDTGCFKYVWQPIFNRVLCHLTILGLFVQCWQGSLLTTCETAMNRG